LGVDQASESWKTSNTASARGAQLLLLKQGNHVVICHSFPPSYHILNRSKHTEEFAGGKGSPRLDYKKNSKLNKNKRASGGMGERERGNKHSTSPNKKTKKNAEGGRDGRRRRRRVRLGGLRGRSIYAGGARVECPCLHRQSDIWVDLSRPIRDGCAVERDRSRVLRVVCWAASVPHGDRATTGPHFSVRHLQFVSPFRPKFVLL
jgi:hypothetical protein